MKGIIKCAAVALALGAAPMVASIPAAAAVDFGITLGPHVAFGFTDGYWDRDDHWHAWRNAAEMRWYQSHFPEHYYGFRHDHDRADRTFGWRNDRWWEDRGPR